MIAQATKQERHRDGVTMAFEFYSAVRDAHDVIRRALHHVDLMDREQLDDLQATRARGQLEYRGFADTLVLQREADRR